MCSFSTQDPVRTATPLVNEGFLPLISKVAGLVAYYGVETGEDGWASINVFETPAGAEESNRVAAEFVKNSPKLERLLKSKPEIIAGSVGAHKAK